MNILGRLVLAPVLEGAILAVVASGGDKGSTTTEALQEEGLGPAEPDDYLLFQRSTGGRLPSHADFARAVRQAQAVRAESASAAPRQLRGTWTLEGPANIGGRLTDLAVADEPDTVYVAAATGGVWKTTVFFLKNGEKNWHAVGTGLPLAPVLDLRLHSPSDTLFAGTFGRSAWSVSLAD